MHTPPLRSIVVGFLGLLMTLALVALVLTIGDRHQAEASRIRADAQSFQELSAQRQAVREQAAEEQAAEEQAAESRAARKQAAREGRAREAARQQAAAEQAAEEKAAREQAAREKAARKAARSRHLITGEMTVPDINGALVTQVGGRPGQPVSDFSLPQLKKLERLLTSLTEGRTYPCPGGAGGGFADVVAGGPVTIKDGAGAVLATTELVGGTLSARGCTFTFSAEVSDADFYQVAVTRRGSLNFSRTDLATTGWRVLARL